MHPANTHSEARLKFNENSFLFNTVFQQFGLQVYCCIKHYIFYLAILVWPLNPVIQTPCLDKFAAGFVFKFLVRKLENSILFGISTAYLPFSLQYGVSLKVMIHFLDFWP